MMKRSVLLATIALAVLAPTAYALYSVANEGLWPKTWPAELEPLRKQSRTLVGPFPEHQHYAIPFTTREEFEAAWPHLLKVKTAGAPVFLLRGPNFFLGKEHKAGVVVHSPPRGQPDRPPTPEGLIAGAKDQRSRWMNATYIDLVVDGEIVDLNRIALPADCPIVDQRFGELGTR
jgi:hypothetical protein